MKRQKKMYLILATLALVIICVLLWNIFINRNKEPKINISITLNSIEEEEYQNNRIFSDYPIDSIKKLDINVEITNSKNCLERIIDIPNLDSTINDDKIRFIEVSHLEQNNILSEDFSFCRNTYYFDFSDLTVIEFTEQLKNQFITVSIIDENHVTTEYTYSIFEILTN